jgi:hypothetical protein
LTETCEESDNFSLLLLSTSRTCSWQKNQVYQFRENDRESGTVASFQERAMATTLEERAVQPAPRETWAMAVVYEDTLTRDRAMAVCDQLVHRFWGEVDFEFSWWREAFLTDSTIAAEAAGAAVNADLILFSTHAEGGLSAGTRAWIETWLDKRGKREGALIDLIGTSDDSGTGAAPTHPYLRQIAERGGLDYVSFDFPITPQVMEDSIESIHHRAGQITSVLDQILSRTPADQSPPGRALED